MHPSIILHMLSGLFLIITISIIVIYFNKIQSFDINNILVLLLLTSIAISIHSISHLGLEKTYNYNPYNLFYESIINVDAKHPHMKMPVMKYEDIKNMTCPCMKNMKCPYMKDGIMNCPCIKNGNMNCPCMKKYYQKIRKNVKFREL